MTSTQPVDREDPESGDGDGGGGSLTGLLEGLDEQALASIPQDLLQRLQLLEEERDELAERLLESDAELCALQASYSQLSQSHASSQTWLNQVLAQQMEIHERRQRRQRRALMSSAGLAQLRLRQAQVLALEQDGNSRDVTGELEFLEEPADTDTDKENTPLVLRSVAPTPSKPARPGPGATDADVVTTRLPLPRALAVRCAMGELEARWRHLARALKRVVSEPLTASSTEHGRGLASRAVAAWATRLWVPAIQKLVLSVAGDDELPEALLSAQQAAAMSSRVCLGIGRSPFGHAAHIIAVGQRLGESLAAMAAIASVHLDAAGGGGAAAVEAQLGYAARCLDWQASRLQAEVETAACRERCSPRGWLAAALQSVGVPRPLVDQALRRSRPVARRHEAPSWEEDPADAAFDAAEWLHRTDHLRGWLQAALTAEEGAWKVWRPLLRSTARAALGRVAHGAPGAEAEVAGALVASPGADAEATARGGWRQMRSRLLGEMRRLSAQAREQWGRAAAGLRQTALPWVPPALEDAVHLLLEAARRAYDRQREATRCECAARAPGEAGEEERFHTNGTVGLSCSRGLAALVLEAQREIFGVRMAATTTAAARKVGPDLGDWGGVAGVSGEMAGALLRFRADVMGLARSVGRVRELCEVARDGAAAYRSQSGME
ncbi:hypothetical protein GPECTOR_2g1214 [Gonium pectorale]|uniref:Uncharacterized protein n=1 Tax=Gonium pectorale TaxID=33097 RepID=A0A150H0U8_GONPE|nr:hypothetical protein GPECTOR_2g1214 [Gonium pectorale]|eukprot:KXZ55664.1 hypothetical protein GPECTOR_2g1214 [Gonium pectorale]